MKLVNNKRSLMTLAAVWIIIFHLWINLFPGNQVEEFIKAVGYISVDLFFFMSAYSLAGRKMTDVGAYYISRFKAVYLKFVAFAVAGAFISGWSISVFLKTIFGINLVERGGGAFLWFLPTITMAYILYPIFDKIAEKKPLAASIAVLIAWFAIGLVVTKFTDYRAMFIFWNRIPAFILGYAAKRFELVLAKPLKPSVKLILGVIFLVVGTLILFKFGFKYKLNEPIHNLYYLVGLPSMVGIALLVDFIPEVGIIKLIGSSTLEIYGLQMVVGYKIANAIYKATGSALVTNLGAILLVIVIAIVLRILWDKVLKNGGNS